jgi:hypothetical protein
LFNTFQIFREFYVLFTREIIQPEMSAMKGNTANDSDKIANITLEGNDLNDTEIGEIENNVIADD